MDEKENKKTIEKEPKHYNIGKFNGIYYNCNRSDINTEYIKNIKKYTRNINYKTLSLYYQSIHHINILLDDNNNLDKIQLNFRNAGIKPEDINGIELVNKIENGEKLTDYENILYMMWSFHYNKGLTKENKQLENVVKYLYDRDKELGIYTTKFEELDTNHLSNLYKQAMELITIIEKY